MVRTLISSMSAAFVVEPSVALAEHDRPLRCIDLDRGEGWLGSVRPILRAGALPARTG